MGCCFSSSDYARLTEEISLADNMLPMLPDETKLKNISESQEKQLRKLFAEFDHGGDNLISYEELQSGLILLKKSPSQKALNRIMKTAHLSAAPKNHIEFKGFALALLSRRSVLYDFLYEGYDTAEELEAEIEAAKKKGSKWNIFSN